MENKAVRLYFVDAMRAWAILMMLQGHFVDGLLDNAFRDTGNLGFNIWKYFRGVTAPVFFTVSGFIFTYLLVRGDKKGFENPRVQKGIKRGLQLLFIGYLLRTNFFGLLNGQIYPSFYLVDVLHCIGFSLIGIVGIYLLTYNKKNYWFPLALVLVTFVLFLFEPYYKQWTYTYLPQLMANYLTKANGSVFTIIPWFGYATVGAFISLVFTKYKNAKHLYPIAISVSIITGLSLIFLSSGLFWNLYELTGLQLFASVYGNNYLFIRLGDVFLVFAIFMIFRRFMTNRTVLGIGQSTLTIYIVHYIILYGSFTGLGLYYFLNHSLSPAIVIPGAILFMVASTYLSLQYEKNKVAIKENVITGLQFVWDQAEPWAFFTLKLFRSYFQRARLAILRLIGLEGN